MFLHSPSMVRTTRCHWKTCLLECLSQPINSSETWWQIISTLETLHLNMMCVCVVVVDGLLSKILSGTYLQLQALVSGIRFHQIPKLCLMILAYWVCPVSPIWDATPSKYTKKKHGVHHLCALKVYRYILIRWCWGYTPPSFQRQGYMEDHLVPTTGLELITLYCKYQILGFSLLGSTPNLW
jgi:hypothetical protein